MVIEFVISTVSFAVCFVFHMLFHRILLLWRKKSMSILLIYIVGIVIQIVSYRVLNASEVTSSSLSAFVFYLGLVCITSIFYFGRILEGLTPSDKILQLLVSKDNFTKATLLKAMSEHELVNLRLFSLIHKRYVYEENCFYRLTNKGKGIFKILEIYSKIFRIEVGG